MGTVTIALPEGRRLNSAVSFNMIAVMTAAYGVGQIIGPLVAGWLHATFDSFSPSLLIASAALVLGALMAKR